jgi:hypothetical protein
VTVISFTLLLSDAGTLPSPKYGTQRALRRHRDTQSLFQFFTLCPSAPGGHNNDFSAQLWVTLFAEGLKKVQVLLETTLRL